MMIFMLLILGLCQPTYAANGDTISLGDDLFRLRPSSGLMVGTTIEARRDIVPGVAGGSSIGSSTLPFGQLFVATANITYAVLPGGSTGYIQNSNSLQPGSTFYVASGTIVGPFSVIGTQTNSGLFTARGGVVSTGVLQGILAAGDTSYIQITNSLQSGATFYVASGTVSTQFIVGGGTLTALANGRVGISSSVPINTLSVQGGGHFTSTVTASNFFISDGTQLLSTAAPVTGSTNYIQNISALQTGAVFNVASGTVSGNLTVTGHLAASGTVTLGDAAGDLLTIRSSSITLINPASYYFNDPASRIVNSSNTICHNFMFNQNNYENLISSTPLTITTDWNTVNSATLDGTNAKAVLLNILCDLLQDATPEDSYTNVNLRRTGSVVARATANSHCQASANNALDLGTDMNMTWIAVDGNKDFDFSCNPSGALSSNRCFLYLAGWCE